MAVYYIGADVPSNNTEVAVEHARAVRLDIELFIGATLDIGIMCLRINTQTVATMAARRTGCP